MTHPQSEAKAIQSQHGQWGRAWQVEMQTFLYVAGILFTTPWMVFYFFISAFYFDCSLSEPIKLLLSGHIGLEDLWNKIPSFTSSTLWIMGIWYALQVTLALVPDGLHYLLGPLYRGGNFLGAMTPSGNRLWYKINGLQAWVLSHLLFLLGAFAFELFQPTIIFDHWGSILIFANIFGFFLALFVYAKSYYFPSFPKDRKFSKNPLYDFFMGIELNPRVGPIDFKLFFNGRPGIVAWTLINISFTAAQYERYGFITNSMILINILHGLYVLYFFWKEEWYLNTIDIHHDHFGWMLAWGDSVWLPYMYTLQGLFLVFHPVELSNTYALTVLGMGLLGFWIFLAANNQKDKFRRLDGQLLIWGEKPSYIPCEYTTKDGELRKTKLLTSGWWGMTRHMNYTGDLILSFAYSLACGLEYLFPYFYFIYMTILLVNRCLRDEHRCENKYGLAWTKYCQQVPYRLIPKIF